MTEINGTYASALLENMVRGTAVASGSRYLTLGTNATTEATTITRVDLDTVLAAASAGTVENDTLIQFTGLDAATITHWIVCSHVSNSVATTWLYRGTLVASATVVTGGSVGFRIGDLTGLLQGIA